jgi:hypothetical protein
MSDAFTDREKGFERKYQFDQEQQFRALARRDKLFGQWVAGKLGHTGAAAEAYAKDVVESNFEKPGDQDMIDKVKRDLSAKGVSIADAELNAQLTKLQNEAAAQVAAEKK